MPRFIDITLSSLAPIVWGSTYIVTTELLPEGYPLTAAMLRALPAGLLLLVLTRTLPTGIWWLRSAILGALNFSVFWWLLFVAAYQLPGGVAATVGATQPLMVLFIARILLGQRVYIASVLAGIGGLIGVAFLVLTSAAELNKLGLLAALIGSVSMAFGVVLTRKWQPPVSPLTFTSWQLTFGGLILLPASLWFEPTLPTMTVSNAAGFIYLGLFGGAITYFFWFRGIARLGPSTIAPLSLLSPLSAVVLGWVILNQSLSVVQGVGIALVLLSVCVGQLTQTQSMMTKK